MKESKKREKRPQIVSLEDSFYAAYRLEEQLTCVVSNPTENLDSGIYIGTLAPQEANDKSLQSAFIQMSMGEHSVFLITSDNNVDQMKITAQQIATC